MARPQPSGPRPAFRSLNADRLSSRSSGVVLVAEDIRHPVWGPEGARGGRGLAVKILIADDNRLMLEGVRRALEPVEDIEIVGATHTGAQVLPLVERRRPDLVALDSGCAARRARCLELLREQHPDIKVVVLSASSA